MAAGSSAAPSTPRELLGDSCLEALGELRSTCPLRPLLTQTQLYGFIDHGRLS